MIAFSEARARVQAEWPDYDTLPDGYETERDWLVLLDPITIGGRIAAVDKNTGRIDWINETSDRYTQEFPASSPANLSHFGALVNRSRERLNRSYSRDSDGRFSSGGPGTGADITGDLDYASLGAAVAASGSTLTPGVPDSAGRAIAHQQGFDGRPEVVSKAGLDAAIADGAIELHRRVGDSGDASAASLAEQFRSGELYVGRGMHGSGTYAAADSRLSDDYGSPAGAIRMALRPGSRTIGTQEARAKMRAESEDWTAEQHQVLRDPGRWAAAKGYDAIVPDTPGGANYVVLNRTAVIVQEAQ